MPTQYPSQTADRFLLRFPDGMRERIAVSAAANNRTMTKEVILRLQQSFESTPANLPETVQMAVDGYAEDHGCTPAQALTELVLAGQSLGRRVLNLRVAPGTTAKEVRDALNIALALAPDADLVLEREPKA